MATYNIDFEHLVLDTYFNYDYRGCKIAGVNIWSKDLYEKFLTDTEKYFEEKTTKNVITDNYDFVSAIFTMQKRIREIDIIIDYKIMYKEIISYSDVIKDELYRIICEFADWKNEQEVSGYDSKLKSYRINDTETVWKDSDDTTLVINNIRISKELYERLAGLGLCYRGL